MNAAICFNCCEDEHLSRIVYEDGTPRECSSCGQEDQNAFSVEELGRLLEPVMRKHFSIGKEVRHFSADDKDWWEQEGDDIHFVIQEVAGQYFEFEDELIESIQAAENIDARSGEEAYWDLGTNYTSTKITGNNYSYQWYDTQWLLKTHRRFFNFEAKDFFTKLFDGVEELKADTYTSDGYKAVNVVRTMPIGTILYRARICPENLRQAVYLDPFLHVGPPPSHAAHAGRMNPEGIAVFYGATDINTAMAELRPAIGSEIATIAVQTTRNLRLLDFSALELARSIKSLSYFQSDFLDQLERTMFLRKLHKLISQPVIPGRESNYLITQTIAEYLSHVHQEPFDGVLFGSSQKDQGINIVLFADINRSDTTTSSVFGIQYSEKSLQFHTTTEVHYAHKKIEFGEDSNGQLFAFSSVDDHADS